ncbi:TPR repeat containing domain [Acetobacter tropicalis]|uniref:TPR repeat containing domain n=2 Tax=Acetobacter tropicalis TaxID=104102 RepID=A0A094YFW8_9PROT|nr:TPR repeat containing domain [Acetobacter tropicalis]
MAGVMSDLSFSVRGSALCVPLGLGLLLLAQPARALPQADKTLSTLHVHEQPRAASPGQAGDHSATPGAGHAAAAWTADACLAMVGEDPFGARDYAQDWLHHGGDRAARHCHALALIELGDEQTAAQELDDLVTKEPFSGPDSSASVRAIMAVEAVDAWLAAGMPQNAVRVADYALAIRPGDEALSVAKARALLELNNPQAVVAELGALVAHTPTAGAEAYVLLASAERRCGQLDKAREHVARALARAPENPAALLEEGIIREQVGDAVGARTDWQRVLDLAPDGHEADLARQDLAVLAADPDAADAESP